jgi:hypothetical protein
MKIPVFTINKLYHNGSLNPDDKNPFSNEGQCLSASVCPSAWISITRKHGECHEMNKNDAKFFDILKFKNNSSLEKRLLKYGKDNGLIEFKKIYEHEFYSGDLDEDMIERSFSKDPNWDDDSTSEKMDWVGTPLLFEKTGSKMKDDSPEDPRDILAICYAENLSLKGDYDIDGIFFDHEYDPIALSAPAFGIFPHKIKEFDIKVTNEPENFENVRVAGKDDFISPSKNLNNVKKPRL